MDVWTNKNIEQLMIAKNKGVLFLTTPICGTCHVAERMLTVVTELIPSLTYSKIDLNYHPDFAERFKIMSVPCLLLYNEGEVKQKIYAFQSVNNLYEQVKNF